MQRFLNWLRVWAARAAQAEKGFENENKKGAEFRPKPKKPEASIFSNETVLGEAEEAAQGEIGEPCDHLECGEWKCYCECHWGENDWQEENSIHNWEIEKEK